MSSPNTHRAVVLGSSFAGLTAALEIRKHLENGHEVVVLDPRDHFTFIPSLIWLPFGIRNRDDVTFPLAPLYAKKGRVRQRGRREHRHRRAHGHDPQWP